MERSGTYQRLGSRYGRGLGLVLFLFVLVVGIFWWWRQQTPSFVSQVSVAIVGDPVQIWTWNRTAQTFVLLIVPSSARIGAVGGYGRYSLDALWRLDTLDKLGGTLFLGSVEDALGLPIRRFIAPQATTIHRSDHLATIKSIFSLTNAFSGVLGRWKMNINPFEFLAFARAVQFARADAVQTIDLGQTAAMVDEELLDGTVQKSLDPDRLDAVLGRVYEDIAIRTEGVSVAVFNTTKTPTLGGRIARLLSHMGVLVVAVGNEAPMTNRCELRGKKETLGSVTAKRIVYYFGCDSKEEENERADLILFLGKEYEKRFSGQTTE